MSTHRIELFAARDEVVAAYRMLTDLTHEPVMQVPSYPTCDSCGRNDARVFEHCTEDASGVSVPVLALCAGGCPATCTVAISEDEVCGVLALVSWEAGSQTLGVCPEHCTPEHAPDPA